MKKTKILVIDDDLVASTLLKAKLERLGGFEARIENRGAYGLAATQKFRPDLVLLDVDMPDADGGDVAFQIQNDKLVGHTPILFLTSMVSEKEADGHDLWRGGYQFMSKSTDFPKLVERIGKILAAQEADAVS